MWLPTIIGDHQQARNFIGPKQSYSKISLNTVYVLSDSIGIPLNRIDTCCICVQMKHYTI